MRGGWGVLLLTLASCGIETVSVLPSPPVDYTAQTTTQAMEFTHDASLYSGTDFQGYEVYYRVYPSGSAGSTQLAKDATLLNSGPLSTLTSMGYRALATGASPDAALATNRLQIVAPANGAVVRLDFGKLLAAENRSRTDVQAELSVGGAFQSFVYRATDLAIGVDGLQKFSRLRTDDTLRSDTATLSTGKSYEVEVFVVAYGTTALLEAVTSIPKAWGTIQTIEP